MEAALSLSLNQFIAKHVDNVFSVEELALSVLKSTNIVFDGHTLLMYNDTDVIFIVFDDTVDIVTRVSFLTKHRAALEGKLFKTSNKKNPIIKYAELLHDDVYRIKKWL